MCGGPDPWVDNRETGDSVRHLIIALCAACHAKVHPDEGSAQLLTATRRLIDGFKLFERQPIGIPLPWAKCS